MCRRKQIPVPAQPCGSCRALRATNEFSVQPPSPPGQEQDCCLKGSVVARGK